MATAVGAGTTPSIQIHAQITSLGLRDSPTLVRDVQQAAQITVQNLTASAGAGAGATAATPGAFSGSALSSAWSAKFDQMSQIGGMLDNMEKEALELQKSPNKADQLRGQQMMAAMQQIMEAIIKAIQSVASVAKHAIDGSQAH